MLIFLNGQIVKEEDAKVRVDDLSYQFGYGLFETVKCEQGVPIFFEDHYRRLTGSAKEIGMPFPVDIIEVKEWIKDVLKANNLSSARLKIIISKRSNDKFNVLILPGNLERTAGSYSILGWKLSRDPGSVSFRHKTTSRADSYVAFKSALENGFDEALYVNEKGELTECTRANIFLVLEDKLITPLLESGILPGVTRSKVMEIAKSSQIQIEEKIVHRLYLNKSVDVFITNSIIGIMPVTRLKLEDKEFNFIKRSELTTRLMNLYDVCVKDYLKSRNLSFSKK